MRLKSLRMVNVRSHKESFVEFNDGSTVIWGKTGSGKSTIFMAIYYALFGSADLSNSQLMRRGAKKMIVELKFIHNNQECEIVRGLKRSGELIQVDPDNLRVMVNGSQANALGRANDINSIISNILGLDGESKPNLMFQILSYTKQDNIKALLEMKKEERQEFIDKMLQLSKYKSSFENLKHIYDYYCFRHEKAAEMAAFLDIESKSSNERQKKIHEISEKLIDNSKKISCLDLSLLAKKGEISKKEDLLLELRQKKEIASANNQKINDNQKRIRALLDEKTSLEQKKSMIKLPEIKCEKSLDELSKELVDKSSALGGIKNDLSRLEREKISILNLKSECISCLQKIPDEHKESLLEKKGLEQNRLLGEKNDLEKKIDDLKALINECKKAKEANDEAERISSLIEVLGKNIDALKKELEGLKEMDSKLLEEKIIEFGNEIKSLHEKSSELFGKKSGIESSSNELKIQLDSLKKEDLEKSKLIEEYKKKSESIGYLKKCIDFLGKIRINVKDIRQIIRQKFLNDFKNSFAKKFEDIRSNDDEYYVEINEDYEPMAFSSNSEKVPISYLSGGEKTSAALAYRLALSDLASEMNNLMPSELLMLDEPTSGFDADDIKALPDALSGLKMPQILIVTHEPLLKEFANSCIEISKKGDESIVSYS